MTLAHRSRATGGGMEDAMTTETDRTLTDIWTPIPWAAVPYIQDTDLDEAFMSAYRTEEGYLVATFATPHTDDRGQTGIAVAIWDVSSVLRYWTRTHTPETLVYGSPMHADDSDKTFLTCISLCTYAATHDENDERIEPGWDADLLADESAVAEDYLDSD